MSSSKDKISHHNFKQIYFDLDYYKHFLTSSLADKWYNHLLSLFDCNSRQALLYGNPDLIYTVSYHGQTTQRTVNPWSDIKGLFELKEYVEIVTKQKYTVCLIQIYPDGNSGIAPHRDKEMVAGTCISGLSLGAMRDLEFSRGRPGFGPEKTKFSLEHGSLYVMNPPTNSYWAHSILKDKTITKPRISLTFRDY